MGGRKLADVQVSWMLGISGITVVSVRDDWIEEFVEKSVRFFVTGNGTDSLDHWVTLIRIILGHFVLKLTLVVDTSLDAVTESNTKRGLLVFVFVPETWVLSKSFGKERVVVREVWELSWWVVSRESGTTFSADVFGVSTSQLNPLWQGTDTSGKTAWWVIRSGTLGINFSKKGSY